MVKITLSDTVICIPPYISTSWNNIKSVHIDDNKSLVFILNDSSKIAIPDLSAEVVQTVFEKHAMAMEKNNRGGGPIIEGNKQNQERLTNLLSKFLKLFSSNQFMGLPIQIGVENSNGIVPIMSHDPTQSNAPDLPKEILDKISTMVQSFEDIESDIIPKPVENCNCIYCQIARAIYGQLGNGQEKDEEVTEEDLKFKEWDIEQTGEKLYQVSNPLDQNEKYTVYLGETLGCTCGKKNCEHIRVVLKS